MKENLPKQVGMLKHLHKLAWDMSYPGYPYMIVATIDKKEDSVWLTKIGSGFHQKMDIQDFLNILSADTADEGVGTTMGSRGSWATGNGKLASVNEILEQSTDEDFYIDNLDIVKLFFATASAIRNTPPDATIYCIYSKENDYLEVRTFQPADTAELEDFVRKQIYVNP